MILCQYDGCCLAVQNVPSVVVRKPPPVKAGTELERPRKKARTEASLGRSVVATPASDMQRFFHARSCTQMTEQEARAAFADPRGEPDSDNEEDLPDWEVSTCTRFTHASAANPFPLKESAELHQ